MSKQSAEGKFADEKETILKALQELDYLAAPSHVRTNYTSIADFHKFERIIDELVEETKVVRVPHSGKGKLIVHREKIDQVIEEAKQNSG